MLLGTTPTGAVLRSALDNHIDQLDNAIQTQKYSEIKPLNIVVITDGNPSE